MKPVWAMFAVVAFTAGCSVMGQSAQKPGGTHYSAASINSHGRLIVFPFDGNEIAIELPATVGGKTFSVNGRILYGFVQTPNGGPPTFAAVTIKPIGVRPFPGPTGFDALNSLTVDAVGDREIFSATYEHDGSGCGLFEFDIKKGSIEKILNNLSGKCDFLSSWRDLSVSPDGSRVVGSAEKGRLGVVNLKEHRIERVWPGDSAWWSPDGKWIAALNAANPAEIELFSASDLSVRRSLGHLEAGSLRWSPDSRYLLAWVAGWCGLGTGYLGTLQILDIETGERLPIKSSTCRVDVNTTGWVSDEVLK